MLWIGAFNVLSYEWTGHGCRRGRKRSCGFPVPILPEDLGLKRPYVQWTLILYWFRAGFCPIISFSFLFVSFPCRPAFWLVWLVMCLLLLLPENWFMSFGRDVKLMEPPCVFEGTVICFHLRTFWGRLLRAFGFLLPWSWSSTGGNGTSHGGMRRVSTKKMDCELA